MPVDADAPMPVQCTIKHSLEGHKGGVMAIRFTKNGRYLLSASQDKSVRLWNPHNGVSVKCYSGPHNHEVNDVIVSEDNSKFVTAGGDKHFFQWDVTSGNIIRKFVGHDRKVNAVAFGPQESLVVSGSSDKSVRIWDLRARGRGSVQCLTDATDSVLCVNVSGDEITTGSTDGQFRRYDVRKGQLVADSLLQPVGSVCYSNDRECALVSTLDDTIRLIERETGNELVSYKGHTNKKFKVQSALDPSDSFVVSGSEDNKFCFWDLVDGNLLHSVRHHAAPVFCVCFHETTLATASADGVIHIWDVAAGAGLGKGTRAATTASMERAGMPSGFGRKGKPLLKYPMPSEDANLEFVRPGEPHVVKVRVPEAAGDDAEELDGAMDDGADADGAPAQPAQPSKKRGDRGKKGKRKLEVVE